MNIIEALEDSAIKYPDRTILKFINSRKEILSEYTYSEFNQSVNYLANYLYKNIGTNQRIILAYPPGAEFIRAFYACLKSNNIPIPVYPPNPYYLHKEVKRFCQIVTDSDVEYVLTNQEYSWQTTIKEIQNKVTFQNTYEWPQNLKWITTDTINPNDPVNIFYQFFTYLYNLIFNKEPQVNPCQDLKLKVNPDQIALIQYTSGSVSHPKGIIIKHQNLIHNINIIRVALDIRFDKPGTCVSWLPQYHDMGLIGSVITTFYTNYTGIYISPLTFIKKPLLLLDLCSQYRCTHLQTPHFIFPLLTRRWSNLDRRDKLDMNLDLSSLHHIFNAAQPINPDEYTEFFQTFKSTGLRKSALTTGYGLAESVVYVSDSGHNSLRGGQVISIDKNLLKENKIKIVSPNNPNSKKIIGCGYPPDNFQVDIYINPLKEKEKKGSQKKEKENNQSEEKNFFRQLIENWLKPFTDFQGLTTEYQDLTTEYPDLIQVGEICLSSPSICSYLYSEETEKQRLKLTDKSYLKTGDLGFIYNNELFYCGRIKDMINVNGENIYPQDIEWSVEKNENVKKGSTISFEINNKIYITIELKDYNLENLTTELNSIKNSISLDHSVAIEKIIILKSKTTPKTTSGKVSRNKTKTLFLEKKLDFFYQF